MKYRFTICNNCKKVFIYYKGNYGYFEIFKCSNKYDISPNMALDCYCDNNWTSIYFDNPEDLSWYALLYCTEYQIEYMKQDFGKYVSL